MTASGSSVSSPEGYITGPAGRCLTSRSVSTSTCSCRTADTGTMSSHWPSWSTAIRCSASRCRSTVSVFVAIATTGVPRPSRRIAASSAAMKRSPGPTFWSAGRQNPTTSTSVSVSRTTSLSRCPRRVLGRCSPGVSTSTSCASSRVTMPRIACRVVCGLDEVMATFSPTSALVSVDLPALGRPTMQAKPDRCPLWSLGRGVLTGPVSQHPPGRQSPRARCARPAR